MEAPNAFDPEAVQIHNETVTKLLARLTHSGTTASAMAEISGELRCWAEFQRTVRNDDANGRSAS